MPTRYFVCGCSEPVRRKTEELNECYEQGESDPQKIDECDNFADPQTKYLVGKVWARHLHLAANLLRPFALS